MLFRKRKKEMSRRLQQEEEIRQLLKEAADERGALSRMMETIKQDMAETGQQNAAYMETAENWHKDQEKWMRRQSDSFEDLLEEVDSWKEEKKYWSDQAKNWKEREDGLLKLFCYYQEQMTLLKNQILTDADKDLERQKAWEKHFSLVEQDIRSLMRPCGMEPVGLEGEPVDYSVHEVLNLVPTEEPEKNGKVARVYSQGIIYGGHVIRKAQVALYKVQ